LRYFLEQKFAVLLQHANLEIRACNASFLQLSKIVVPFINFRSERLRSRRSAKSVLELKSRAIKNPATSAGHVRPFLVGRFTRAASGTDMLDSRFA
jgi:hypothetical protein